MTHFEQKALDEERGRRWWHDTQPWDFHWKIGALLRERDEALARADHLGIEMQGQKARAEKAEADLRGAKAKLDEMLSEDECPKCGCGPASTCYGCRWLEAEARAEKAEAECERLREAAQTAIDAWLKVDHDTDLYHECIALAKIVNGDKAALRGERGEEDR